MTVGLNDFIGAVCASPFLSVSVILIFAVILVNGWTDAPNAIATCVSTRCIGVRGAIAMAAVFNFFGLLVMTAVNSSVAQTIYVMTDFGNDGKSAMVALCAAMTAIVLWATAAWYFGIPTSESHALIAGITGAAVAVNSGFSGVNSSEWVKIICGLFFSVITGFLIGFLTVKTVAAIFKNIDRRKSSAFFKYMQIGGAAAMAFMHGAQDGQKFMGVMLLALTISTQGTQTEFIVPVWLMLSCSFVMALGTSIGGYRIIKSVGMDMVKLEKYQGFSADLAGALSLFLLSCFGIPVSTTHTKVTAIMGVGAAKTMRSVNWGVVREMVFAWVLTFPGCGLVGWLTALLFLKFF